MFIAILGLLAFAIAFYFLYQFKKELHQLRAPIPKPDKRPLEDNPFGFVPNTDYQQTHFPWRNVIDCKVSTLKIWEEANGRPQLSPTIASDVLKFSSVSSTP